VSASAVESLQNLSDDGRRRLTWLSGWGPAHPLLLVLGLALVGTGLIVLDLRWLAVGTVLWLAGLILVAGGVWRPADAARARALSLARWEVGGLAVVLVVGLALRLWAPEAYPGGIHVDEAAMSLVAVDVLHGRGPYPFGFAFIGDPAPFMYAEALMMWLFGVGVGSARLLAGLAGAAGLLTLWLLARQLFGASVAMLATALLAVTAAHLHFSRMALNVIEIPLFGVMAIALVWRGFQQRRAIWHLLGGMALGFAQYANFGARAYVLGTAAFYGLMLVQQPRAWRQTIGAGLLALFGMLLVLGPQIAFVRDDPASMVDRMKYRSVFRRWDQATEIHGTDDTVGVMAGQLVLNLQAFVSNYDRGPFFQFAQQPLLPPPLAMLFLIGVLIAIIRIRDPRFGLLVLVSAGVLAAGVLSAGAPQFHRLLPMLPIACLLAANAAAVWFAMATGLARRWSPRTVRMAGLVLSSALVLWVGVDGMVTVFGRPAENAPWQPQTAWARWAGEQAGQQTVLLAGSPDVFAWDERVRLHVGEGTVWDVTNPTADLAAAQAEGKPFVLALNPKLDDWLPLLRHQLPDIPFEPVLDARGRPLLLAAYVPAALPRPTERRGLRGLLTIDEAPMPIAREDAALAFRESSRLSDRRPFRATWTGALLVERSGLHRLELFTDGGGSLVVDGQTILEGRPAPNARSLRAEQTLTAGEHTFEVRYAYVRGPGTFELRWQPPGGERTLVPPSALRPD